MLQDLNRAREYYQAGLKVCNDNVPLWLSLIRLEEKSKGVNKARSTLELARIKIPKNDVLWLESVKLERRSGNEKLAESLMAQAMHECTSNCGLLWAHEVLACPKHQQKSKSVDALKKCDNDPFVIIAVAR